MKKKLLSALLCVSMVASLLVGCGSNTNEAVDKETQDIVDKSNAEGGYAPVAVENIKVGVIHIGDPAAGSGYSYTHDQGIVAMQKNLGLKDDQIIRKNNVADDDPTAIEAAMTECIEEGAIIIFATSYGYMDTCEKLAAEYPDVIFSHGTGYKSNGANFNNYFGRIYQSRYLSGIAAGLKTETNKLGYVAAFGKTLSETAGGINAFAMGAYSVNPDCEVYVKVTNSWYDPEGETQAAQALIADGCDVIAQHCDTPNPQLAAEEAGVFGVGYNSDMSKDAPGAVLCSTMWDWGAYYTWAVQQLIDGTWTGANYYGGMQEGLVTLSDLSDLNNPEAAAKIEEVKAKIMDGSFNVFDGVIETNEGTTVGVEGGTLDDATIQGGINWYFKNVTEK
ncbi:MAG: BMP family ABC transporter substrate-binding protein [Lachnospiraceae bacterium]|nr:BMP family ABC transporter substrate-binding protein [Lachnospiraceae bacterium]